MLWHVKDPTCNFQTGCGVHLMPAHLGGKEFDLANVCKNLQIV